MRQSHNTTKREITNLNYASVRNCSTHECETRIHLEYKYKLLNLLLWIAEAIQAPNLIARFDSFDFRKQDWSSYWVPAPYCDANADFQSQNRWINTQQLAAAAIACYYNSLLFFLHQFHEFGSSSGQVVQSTSRNLVHKFATFSEKWQGSDSNPTQKRLARRFSLKGYLEPKWLRWT